MTRSFRSAWATANGNRSSRTAGFSMLELLFVLGIILLVIKLGQGFVKNLAVLIGITVGYIVTGSVPWRSWTGLTTWSAPSFTLGAGRQHTW